LERLIIFILIERNIVAPSQKQRTDLERTRESK
jgi:hypothetical protein